MVFIITILNGVKSQEVPMKVSRAQVAQHRMRIMEAAAKLFRQRGFEAVTVAEIMKAAGLTVGAFYGHFPSKEALIAASVGSALPKAPESATQRRRIEHLSVDAAGDRPEDKRSSAIAAWSAMVGAMVLARLVNDDELSKEILAKTRAALPLIA